MCLLLALLLLAGEAWAGCAANTISYWGFQNVTTDPCNSYNLTTVGTLTFDNSNYCTVPGTYMRGGAGAGEYEDAPAGFLTAFQAAANFTVEGYFYMTGNSDFSVLWRVFNIPDNQAIELIAYTTGLPTTNLVLRRYAGAWTHVTSLTSISQGVCYQFATTVSGSTGKIYLNGTEDVSGSLGGGQMATASSFRMPGGGSMWPGFFSGIRASNIARTSFPTIDPAANTTRAMKLRKMMRLDQ